MIMINRKIQIRRRNFTQTYHMEITKGPYYISYIDFIWNITLFHNFEFVKWCYNHSTHRSSKYISHMFVFSVIHEKIIQSKTNRINGGILYKWIGHALEETFRR